MNGLIKVLLADDHPMFLDGVRNALQQYPTIQIVAECTDGSSVEDYIRRHPVDVAVLDINMPGANGIELAKAIRRDYPHTKVIFLTMYNTEEVGRETVFSPYTNGYVLKNSGSQVLSEAIATAFEGGRYIDPKLKDDVAVPQTSSLPAAVKLSSREKEIIRLIRAGLGNREIADQLFLSELTVKTHRKNMYQKLGVNNVAGLLQAVQSLAID